MQVDVQQAIGDLLIGQSPGLVPVHAIEEAVQLPKLRWRHAVLPQQHVDLAAKEVLKEMYHIISDRVVEKTILVDTRLFYSILLYSFSLKFYSIFLVYSILFYSSLFFSILSSLV